MFEIYKRAIESHYDDPELTSVLSIVALMSWENENFSIDVIRYIVKG